MKGSLDTDKLKDEILFRTSRSGGKGGQHVNKVETAVELVFDIANSRVLTFRQKSRTYELFRNRIDGSGCLHLKCEETRSQKRNKDLVFLRFLHLMNRVLNPRKKRVPTTLPKRILMRRRINKQRHSEKKMRRRRPGEERF